MKIKIENESPISFFSPQPSPILAISSSPLLPPTIYPPHFEQNLQPFLERRQIYVYVRGTSSQKIKSTGAFQKEKISPFKFVRANYIELLWSNEE